VVRNLTTDCRLEKFICLRNPESSVRPVYVGNLRQYRAVAIDVGDQDGLRIGAGKLHETLDNYGIANTIEIYHGTHTSAVADRFQNHVLPFFSKNLCFGKGCM
jgi:hypothetical protein